MLDGTDVLAELFTDMEGRLVTRTSIVLFMITTDYHIAQRDCILYLIPTRQDPVTTEANECINECINGCI